MSGTMSLILVSALLAAILLSTWLAVHKPEAVFNTYAVIAVLTIAAAMVFSVMHFSASGPLLILVQVLGMGAAVYMLWNHWSDGRGKSRPAA